MDYALPQGERAMMIMMMMIATNVMIRVVARNLIQIQDHDNNPHCSTYLVLFFNAISIKFIITIKVDEKPQSILKCI